MKGRTGVSQETEGPKDRAQNLPREGGLSKLYTVPQLDKATSRAVPQRYRVRAPRATCVYKAMWRAHQARQIHPRDADP